MGPVTGVKAPTELASFGQFFGREPELRALLTSLEHAHAGRGSLFLIGGEPGIGKSRLSDEFARQARASGARVLWGRCWEGAGAPAYWPWIQALRAHIRTTDPAEVRGQLVAGAADVAQMLPEIGTLVPDLPPPPPASDSARFQLFDSTASFLRNISRAQPTVLVLDDLQAADTASILLLRFLASQLSDMRLVAVATYRDVELTPDHPVAAAISELAREPTTHQMHLRGLGISEVALLAERSAGQAAPSTLVRELHRQTNGNPLFVGEAVKLLASEGGFTDAPDTASLRFAMPGAVRDVISRRLGHLTKQCRAALTLAAVVGPEVPVEALRRLVGAPIEKLLETLDEATGSGLLVEVGGAIKRYRFSHDLVREVLYDDLGAAHRVRLHLQAGEALEAIHAADPDRHLGEIAYHYFQAMPVADPVKVVNFARRAAEHAARQLAYEESVRLYGMALQAMELDESTGEAALCELLLELGDAQMRAGDTPRAKETFLGAASIARRLSLPEHLARAALGYGGRFVWARAANDRQVIPLLEDALEALGPTNTVLRARVLARLAGALRDQPRADARDALSRESVEIARRLDDEAALAYALDGRYSAIWAPDTIEERVRIADEIIAIAERTGDAERAFQGHHYRLAVFLERGDIPAVKSELDANSRLADELRQPAQRWYVRTSVAILSLLEGRFAEAEGLISDAFEHGRQAESVHALGVVRLQQYALRREQGRATELEEPLRGLLDEYAFWPWMRFALLHLYTELDRRADARSLLEALAGEDFRDLPWDNDWLMGMSLVADVVAYLRDGARAQTLYDLLLPYADRNGYGHPEFCTGSMSRPLGTLAAQLSRWQDAERHFVEALEMNERMGAWPWIAHTKREYAAMLLARGQNADRQKARELLDDALRTARELGMSSIERKITELLGESWPVAGAVPDVGPSSSGGVAGMFRREGDYWTITFEADSFRLRDAKGLRYLARLLAEPGRELLALDLVQEGGRASPAAATDPDLRPTDLGDAGTLLDTEAKQAYRARVHELQEELDEAEAWNDAERADRARQEMDFLAQELARAVGLGGRDRAAGSASERARLSVTRAIRLAMARIAAQSTALGDHLEATIRTGTYCSYRPDSRLSVSWQR